MTRGLFRSGQRQQRFLNIDEIATLCRVSPKKIKQWLARQTVSPAAKDESTVELGELLSFLVGHHMPVPASLLPPNTGKILFIITDATFPQKETMIDRICKIFLENRAFALVETSLLSRSTQLTILTFMPDTVVILAPEADDNDDLEGIVKLLAGLPATRTLRLNATDTTGISVEPAARLPGEPSLKRDLTEERLTAKLRRFFAD